MLRPVLLSAGLALGLSACAHPAERQAAIKACETVGISASDAQFDICTKAMMQQGREMRLERAYHDALAVPPEHRSRPVETPYPP